MALCNQQFDFDALLRLGARRLRPLLDRREEDPDWMRRSYDTERRAWHAYYDILDRVEEEAQEQSVEAKELIRKAEAIIEAARVAT